MMMMIIIYRCSLVTRMNKSERTREKYDILYRLTSFFQLEASVELNVETVQSSSEVSEMFQMTDDIIFHYPCLDKTYLVHFDKDIHLDMTAGIDVR